MTSTQYTVVSVGVTEMVSEVSPVDQSKSVELKLFEPKGIFDEKFVQWD